MTLRTAYTLGFVLANASRIAERCRPPGAGAGRQSGPRPEGEP